MRQTNDLPQATANPAQGYLMQSLEPVRTWQPHQIGASGYLDHLHVLAWLVSALRPSQSIGLGVGQGVAYFALCQAVSEFGLDARLFGIDLWPAPAASIATVAPAQVPEALREHNQHHYAAISRLICADPAGAAEIFDFGGIDLLLVDQDLSPAMLENLLDQWRPLMSAKGVIVLRGLKAARKNDKTRAAVQALTQSLPHLDLAAGSGLLLLLVGEAPVETLALAAGLPAGSSDRDMLEQEFVRLGASLRNAIAAEENRARLEAMTRDLAELGMAMTKEIAARNTAQAQADALRARSDALQEALTQATARLAERDMVLAEQALQLESNQHEREALTAVLETRTADAAAATHALQEALTQATARLAERDMVLAEQAEQLESNQHEREALTAALETRTADAAAATHALQEALTQATARLAERDMVLAEQAEQLESNQHEREALTAVLETRTAELLALTRIAENIRADLQQRSQDHEAATANLDHIRVELAQKDKALEDERRCRAADAAAAAHALHEALTM